MSKHMRKRKVPVIVPILIAAVAVLLVTGIVLFVILFLRGDDSEVILTPDQESGYAENADPETDPETEEKPENIGETVSPETEDGTDPEDPDKEKEPESAKPTAKPGTNKPGSNQSGSNEDGSDDPTDLPQREEAYYEEWLAAAMVIGVSMEYPDFELSGIYTPSATALTDKESSDGVYLMFTSGGQTMAIHSSALNGERSTSGTSDISSQLLGFASFDAVSPETVNTGSMTEIPLEDLEALIGQSLLVSIHTR